jgi:hypothetical protein
MMTDSAINLHNLTKDMIENDKNEQILNKKSVPGRIFEITKSKYFLLLII